MTFEAIYEAENDYIDFHPNPNGSTKKLAFTFSSLHSLYQVREKLGFGIDFLHRNGFDVVAFKSSSASWFQDYPTQTAALIEAFLASRGNTYTLRVGYGTSMGGSGAIMFSRELQLNRVLAISPQITATAPWERRWTEFLPPGFEFSLDPSRVSESTDFYFVLDQFDRTDARHIRGLRDIIAPERTNILSINHTGHMTSFCLQQVREFAPLVLSVLNTGVFPNTAAAFHGKRQQSPLYLAHLAESLFASGRTDSAIKIVDRALPQASSAEEEPPNLFTDNLSADVVGPLLNKSKYLAHIGRVNEAIGCSRQAVDHARRSDPARLPFALNSLASFLGAAGDPAAALLACDEAAALKPAHGPLQGYRASYLAALGRQDEAVTAARRQVELAPSMPGAHQSLSHMLAVSGHLDEALVSIDLALSLDPENRSYLAAKSHLLQCLGRGAEASLVLRAMIEAKPDDHANMCALSHLVFSLGQLHEAITWIDAAIARDDHVSAYHSHRSTLYFHQAKPDDAIASARQALTCDPGNAALSHALSHLLAAYGHRAEALAVIDHAIAGEPENATFLAHRATLTV
jgi:tetratricopeptide (TPR) repeat protein